jgi:CheY-like chemotaxis protein
MPKTIMVVDDEEDTQLLVKGLLEEEGFAVVTLSSGEDALAALRKKPVDLVLLDFYMPNMDGKRVCQEIRKDAALNSCKIAFFTIAQFQKEDLLDLKLLDVVDYIQKPFDNFDFVERIKRILI